MLWLGLHFPCLPLEVFRLAEGRADAGISGSQGSDQGFATPAQSCDPLPQVVVDGNRVLLRNEAAVAAGIGIGSTLATAHSIAPGLRHYRRDPEQEARRLRRLAETLYGFSAQVSLAPPDGVVLEAGGSLRLFGDVGALAQQAVAQMAALGHEVRCRWAATPGAALLLARAGCRQLTEVPLSATRLSADQVERLANMGVHSLGQLLALPGRELARRFDQALVDYLQRLTGDLADPQPLLQPSARFRQALHLLEPLNSKEALLFPMRRLLVELHHWLVARQLGAERLIWRFVSSAGAAAALCLPVRFARAQQQVAAFLDITRLRLDQAELPEDVISLSLEARRLQPWTAGSRALFQHLPGHPAGGPAGDRSATAAVDDLHELVDQLRARLGHDACCSIRVLDQHAPEHAWQPVTPLPQRAVQGRRRGRASAEPDGTGAQAVADVPQRPLWLFEPPRATDPSRLVLLRGPERIQSNWWQEAASRDYYVARLDSGAECWAFVDAHDRWFLHGYFA